MNRRLFGLLLFFLILIATPALAAGPGPADSQLKIQEDGKPVANGAFLALSQAFEEVSTRVAPAVVNINTEEVITRTGGVMAPDPENPLPEPFRRFGLGTPQIPEQETTRSLGSGIIVDPKGYIITNNHVVEGATRIKVSLPGGEEYTAKIIGTDEISDIAVIKIDGNKSFPFVRIGDSKKIKVGDWVVAFGSPFGLDQTVTAGIISATARTFKQNEAPGYAFFNDYLQTDASINRGNSGGPLVNMNAEVIGINSFISTTTGSSAGVGFAAPSHLFVRVYNQILQKGKVSRGWLGVSYNNLPFTPEMAKFFGVKQGSGVLVTKLTDEKGGDSETGPAAKAGIKPEDVIVEYDGKKIIDPQGFRMAVADTTPGQKVSIKIVRRGEEKIIDVAIAERVLEEKEKGGDIIQPEPKNKIGIGLLIDDVPAQFLKAANIPGGAYLTTVKPGSLAEDAKLQGTNLGGVGDIIVTANGTPISDAQSLVSIVKSLKSGDGLVLKLLRPDQGQPLKFSILYTSIVIP
jgi:serine protease Do